MPHAPPGGQNENFMSVEVNVPGDKAGLIIGKGGETIKRLQEENNVKMVLIQQSNMATMEDKPLKISGEAQHVERVKQIVLELVNSMSVSSNILLVKVRGHGKPMASEGQEMTKYAVPAEKAGLVIGKGGESIKEICRVTNAHVEISKEVAPDPSIKIFNIRGGSSEIEHAIRLISDRAGIQMTRPNSAVNAQAGYGYGYMADPNSAYGQPAASNGNMPTPSYNPYTGQPDYSAAWIEYYRRLGMHENADAIQRQAQQQQAAASAMPVAAGGPQPAPVGATGAPVAPTTQAPAMGSAAGYPGAVAGSQPQPGAGQTDYNQWQQWQQWQASQWQQWQQPAAGAVASGAPAPSARQPSAVE